MQIAAGEEILVGETGNDPAFQLGSTPGVAFEQIVLTIDEPGEPACLLADVSLNGIVDFNDIPFFVDILLNP